MSADGDDDDDDDNDAVPVCVRREEDEPGLLWTVV